MQLPLDFKRLSRPLTNIRVPPFEIITFTHRKGLQVTELDMWRSHEWLVYPWCSQRCSTVYKLKYSKLNINNKWKIIVHFRTFNNSFLLAFLFTFHQSPRALPVRLSADYVLPTPLPSTSVCPRLPPDLRSTLVTSHLYIVAVIVGGDWRPVGVTRTTSSVESMFDVQQETSHAPSGLRMLQN
jgi:hypothetical protein